MFVASRFNTYKEFALAYLVVVLTKQRQKGEWTQRWLSRTTGPWCVR